MDSLGLLGLWRDFRQRAHCSSPLFKLHARDYLAHAQMETGLPMLVWREFGAVDSFELTLANADGEQRSVTLSARDRAGFKDASERRADVFELDWNVREARIAGKMAYLRPGPFYDNRPEATHPWDPAAFITFIDDAFARFIAAGADSLLIDLRNNPGGDNSFSDPMLAWFADREFRFASAFDIRISEAAIASNQVRLQMQGGADDTVSARLAAMYADKPLRSKVRFEIAQVTPRTGKRFTGPVYLLINRHSYSNTALVAAIAQDYGFGTILGEETADLGSTYGAMEQFTLPHTGIDVGFPKARILRPSGDPQARGVIPDIAIATPIAASSDDVVLARAMQIVAQRQPAAARSQAGDGGG